MNITLHLVIGIPESEILYGSSPNMKPQEITAYTKTVRKRLTSKLFEAIMNVTPITIENFRFSPDRWNAKEHSFTYTRNLPNLIDVHTAERMRKNGWELNPACSWVVKKD